MARSASPALATLQRPSGAFAMLAVDQRESMRAMFAEKQDGPVSDAQLSDFKMAALRVLTPAASAVLIDRPFAWDRAVAEKAVAPGCGLIAAADDFIPAHGELVGEVELDPLVEPAKVKKDGGVALKLLVPWRPDQTPESRRALVEAFLARCREADLISIVEPVSRRPRDGRAWDAEAGILAAARELGSCGADLYKAEVPNYGKGGEALVRRQAAELTEIIASPWVVLSSGVAPDDFPQAVEWCCKEGASGFLAGRAVWRTVIGNADTEKALREDALPRLERLCEVVDRAR
jgi:sulfofructosephosphate aldolase